MIPIPIRVLIIACIAACASDCLAQVPQSQAQSELQDLRENVSTLTRDISTLAQELRLVQNRLDELTHPAVPPSYITPISPIGLRINVAGAPFSGDETASVVIIEYTDFECPFCKRFRQEIYPPILKHYISTGLVKYVYKDFPLQMHVHSLWAAHAVRCAAEQGKSLLMRDILLAVDQPLDESTTTRRAEELGINTKELTECLSSDRHVREILEDVSHGQKLGIDRTPTFLIGTVGARSGQMRISDILRGFSSFELFSGELDRELKHNN